MTVLCSISNPHTNRREISRKPFQSLSAVFSAATNAKLFLALPALAKRSPWPTSLRKHSARRATVQRVSPVFSGQRRGIFRFVLRLLSAGSVFGAHRHLHRKRSAN